MTLDDWKAELLALGDAPTIERLRSCGGLLERMLLESVVTETTGDVGGKGALPNTDDNHVWLPHEIDAWLGAEAIRSFLAAGKGVPGQNPLLDTCATIAADRRFGRGRCNAVGALGAFGGDAYERSLVAFLDEPTLFGHAMSALRDAGIGAYSAKAIEQYRGDEPPWVTAVLFDYVRFCTETELSE